MKDSYYDGVKDALDKVFGLLTDDFQIDSDTAFEKLEEIEQSLLLFYPKKIKVSQKSLDEFKKQVQDICTFPKEIEEEFENLY